MTETGSPSARPAVDTAAEPLFLVGSERSGTTLLRLMLDHHPQLAFHFEFEYSVDRLADGGAWPDLAEFHDYLRLNRVFQVSQFEIDPALPYPDLLRSFLRQKQVRDNKPFVGATVHYHFDRLLRVWPNARFIYLLRDGRDVARSCIRMGWVGNAFMGADTWTEAVDLWETLKPQIPGERRIEMRYEDLVQRPREELERLCRWIGVPFREELFDYTKTTGYKMPDAKLMEQWRRKMTPEEIQLVEAKIGDRLVRNGYDLSGLPRIALTPSVVHRLQRDSRWKAFRFRVKKYGPVLVLAGAVARRLGLKGLAKRVQEGQNAKDRARLGGRKQQQASN